MSIFIKRQFMRLAQRNMEGYAAGAGIKRFQTCAACHPKDSKSVLTRRLDIVAAQTQPITGVVPEPSGFPRMGIESAKTTTGG